ncbi:hypothetical protein ACU6U9_09510 [Pseudomonas sp. HK3]|jgi:hypothetical protein
MTSWLNAFKAMLQQLVEPQQKLQPIKIEVQHQQQRVQTQRRRRR